MVNKIVIFRYKTVKGCLHKLPALLKLLIFLPLSALCLSFSHFCLLAGIILAIITGLICKITIQEQAADIKPVTFYASLMYMISILSNLSEYFSIIPVSAFTAAIFIPNRDLIQIVLRLFFMVQLCALLFRTTSSIEIRESLFSIERFIRSILKRLPVIGKLISQNISFSDSLSLFLSFIPEVFSTWTSISLAWKARGGKKHFANLKTLIFILITLSFEKAAVKAKALEAREN